MRWLGRIPASAAVLCVLAAIASAAPAGAAEPGVVVPRLDDVPATVARVQAAGARHVRLFVSWRALEPSPGTLGGDLARYDDAVDRLRALGISTYFVVLQTPAWATSSGAADAPPPPGAYADFMRRLAAHFRGRVQAYEVWNEPDFPVFWRGGASAGDYTALLRATYPAVKAGDPAARVGVGGLVGNDYTYLGYLYLAGAKGSFDFVGVHTDNDCNGDPRQAARDVDGRIERFAFTGYREVRETMLANGDDKPIWMTELGWSTTSIRCPANRRRRAGVTPAVQAAYLSRAYACLAADPYVEKGTWFSLNDFGPDDSIGTRFGLLSFGGARRPAFAAFRRAARVAPDRRCGLRTDRVPPTLTLSAPRDGQLRSGDLYYRAGASDAGGLRTLALFVDGRRVRVTARRLLRGRWTGWRRLAYGPHVVRFQAVDRALNATSRTVTVTRVPYGQGEPIPTRIALNVYGSGPDRLAAARLYTLPHVARALAQGDLTLRWERRAGTLWVAVGGASTAPVGDAVRSRRHLGPGSYRVVVAYSGFRSFRRAVARRGFAVG
jgi:hypothetical protein